MFALIHRTKQTPKNVLVCETKAFVYLCVDTRHVWLRVMNGSARMFRSLSRCCHGCHSDVMSSTAQLCRRACWENSPQWNPDGDGRSRWGWSLGGAVRGPDRCWASERKDPVGLRTQQVSTFDPPQSWKLALSSWWLWMIYGSSQQRKIYVGHLWKLKAVFDVWWG